MDEQTTTAVVPQGPMTGDDVVDAVEDAKAALDRNPEFNGLSYEPTAPAGEVKSLGLPESLTTPDPLAAQGATGSTSDASVQAPTATTPIKELLPALDSAASEAPTETATTSTP